MLAKQAAAIKCLIIDEAKVEVVVIGDWTSVSQLARWTGAEVLLLVSVLVNYSKWMDESFKDTKPIYMYTETLYFIG